LRILASTPLYPPRSRVGSWLSTHACLAWLASRGHDAHVVPLNGCSQPYELDGVRVTPSTMGAKLPVDIVVSHLGDNGRGQHVADALGAPSVVMVHGPVTSTDHAALAGAALVVFNSCATRDAAGWGGPSVVVHPPVWPQHYKARPGQHVSIINCSIPKGIGVFDLVARSTPQAQFLGVRGSYGRQVMRPAPNITFLATTVDMRSVYGLTRILLMPSDHETWGRVGVEAMCSGIPVIAHPTAGLLESLGGAGTFVDRNDIAGWRNEVLRLLDPEQWQAASQRAIERSQELHPVADLERLEMALWGLAQEPACAL
jgi:glycosyltransferase involved in cell wall biosynthesis